MSIFLANKVVDLEATVKALIARVEELEQLKGLLQQGLDNMSMVSHAPVPPEPQATAVPSQTLSRRHAR